MQTSGYAVDGYLQGSAVLCDSDGNGVPSVGEVTASSSSGGLFTFPDGCGSSMVVTGGASADTGLTFTGTLKAPAGSTVVTPLTTLLVAGLTQDQLNATLSLPAGTDLTKTDPATSADGALVKPGLMKKTLAVQQLIMKTAEMLNGLTVAPDAAALPAIYNEVAAAFADFLKGGRVLSKTDTTLDVAVVGELVKAGATRVSKAPALSRAVRDAAKSVNAGALAGVTAGGLQVQGEALLKVKGKVAKDLSDETKVQQSDAQITEYVVANRAALAGTPSADTVNALGKTLTDQVIASQSSGGGGSDSGNTGTCTAGACIDFSGATVGLGAFGDDGGGYAAIGIDPKDTTNKVAKIVKKPGDQVYLGASIYTNAAAKAFDPPIVLTATNNTITLRVYSPAVGEKILLKVENLPAGGDASQEIQVATTKANAWETLSFTFSAAGTYNTISVLPHFGTAVAAETTFYVDELKRPVPGSGGGGDSGDIDFSSPTVGLGAFGDDGGGYAAIDNDPTDASNKVAKIVKKPGDQVYLGASVYTNAAAKAFDPPIVLTATNNTITLRVYSPAVGEKILLKVENLPAGGDASQEIQVSTTKANAWETLTFTFAAPGTYNTISILPHFGTSVSAETTFYFDDLTRPAPAAGGSDTTPPTVTIADDVPGDTATGSVTFSFTFSESIGSSFTASDVVVGGGTAGSFTLVSPTLATLVVDPPAAAKGKLVVSVAAGKYADAAGNLNTATASAQQAFDTTGGGGSGSTVLVSFDEATAPVLTGFAGAENSTVGAGPAGSTGKVAKVVRAADALVYAGTSVSTARIPFTDSAKTMTVRVWSPDAGIPVRLKVEDAADPSKSVETEAMVTVAGGWQTLTFDFANPVAGTPALNLANTYNKVTIFFNFGKTGAEAGGEKTYYFDQIAFVASSGPDTTPPTVTITDDYPGPTASGPVTFTFKFSESVGTSFTTGDIAVTGGTKGIFTLVSVTQATLVVTPPATSTGTIKVSVAASKFSDAAGNLNTAAASAEQAFDTKNVGASTLLVSFDESPEVISGLGAYGGALPSVESGPAGGSGNALKILKPVSPDTWGGAYFTVPAIAFESGRKTITARVNSTRAGAVIKFKVQFSSSDPGVEVASSPTGAANTWSTVTWNLAAVDPTKAYTTIAITPDADTVTSGQSYFIDDITLAGGSGPPAPLTIATLDEPGAVLTGFEGCYDSTIVPDPAGGGSMVGKVVKPGSGVPFYCGTTIVTVANGGFTPIPFTASAKTVTVRVWSPTAGIPVRLKVEDIGDATKSVETQTNTTKVGWQTLTFNFANPAAGTPALNLATTYNKATIFFNFGSLGTGETYYFDDITFMTGTGTNLALATFDERNYDNTQSQPSILTGFGGAENSTVIGYADVGVPADGTKTGKLAKVVKNSGETYAGTSVQRSVNDAVPTIPFATGVTKMSVRVYSAYPGMRVHLKVEQSGRPDYNSEVDSFTTKTNTWETLVFDFGPASMHFVPSGPGPTGYQTDPNKPGYLPTAQLDVTKTFNKVSIFFDYGLGDAGYDAMPATRTYYFDDVKFIGP